MPLKFQHFSGEGFEKRKADLLAIAEWHRSNSTPLRLTVQNAVPEKRGGGDVDGESKAKKVLLLRDREGIAEESMARVNDNQSLSRLDEVPSAERVPDLEQE